MLHMILNPIRGSWTAHTSERMACIAMIIDQTDQNQLCLLFTLPLLRLVVPQRYRNLPSFSIGQYPKTALP
jgi:hypothetical protein